MNSIYTQLPVSVGTWPPGNGRCGGQAGPLGGGTEPAESLASSLWPWESRKGPGLGPHLQGGAARGLICDSVGTRVVHTRCPASRERQREFPPSSQALEGRPGFLPGSPRSPQLRLGWSARRPLTVPPNPQPTSPSSGHHPSSSWCRRASGCSCRCSWCPSCRCSSGWTPPTRARCVVRPAVGLGRRGRGSGGERGWAVRPEVGTGESVAPRARPGPRHGKAGRADGEQGTLPSQRASCGGCPPPDQGSSADGFGTNILGWGSPAGPRCGGACRTHRRPGAWAELGGPLMPPPAPRPVRELQPEPGRRLPDHQRRSGGHGRRLRQHLEDAGRLPQRQERLRGPLLPQRGERYPQPGGGGASGYPAAGPGSCPSVSPGLQGGWGWG